MDYHGSLVCRYRIIDARKDGVKFTNRALEGAAAMLQESSARYEELQKELVDQVCGRK
jgi:hypothetical protein